jgi:hypothetical protein
MHDASPTPVVHALRTALDGMRARSRLPVDDAASALLDVLVDAAAERSLKDDPTNVRRDEAVTHLRILFDDMTQQSRILRFDAIHAPNVVDALERLCPLWPFCT